MSEPRKLTRKQSAVIEDLFTSELAEIEILAKHGVTWGQYERWLADDRFAEQIERRIVHTGRQSRIILARSAAKAAEKLVELAAGEKGETTRRACLDIIALHAGQRSPGGADPMPGAPAVAGLSPDLAGRLLAALARDGQDAQTCPNAP